jgi:2-oxoglutarate ferredoxin oxidoreductase subunit beta
MDNQIYGLTTGQISPTSRLGAKTKSTPHGSVEMPINPLTSAIMNGATFVARGFSGDTKQLTDLMKQAIEHKGFAHINVLSPCLTFNHDNDFPFFKPRVRKLEDEGHDTSDWKAACEKAMEWGENIYTGVFLQIEGQASLEEEEPVLEDGGPLSFRPLGLSTEQTKNIIKRMM